MSSTSNVQNLLTNVFRPTFVYDTTNGVYQTKLELTNIDAVSANTVYGFTAAFGDASGNVYVGIGSGNPYSSLAASSNSSNTFVGTNAGASTSNVKNGVFLGYRSGFGTSNSSNSISIGANTLNGGNSNIYIGCATGIASGSNNIFLGPGISNGGTAVSNRLMIGSGSNTAIVGDLSSNRVGINLSTLPITTPNLTLDVNGFTRIGTNANGGLGINMLPGNYALDVTGAQRIQDGVGTLIFNNGRLGVNNTSAPLFTLDVTGSQRISNADGSMIFSNGNLTASNASGSMIFSNGNLTASNASGSLSLVGNKVGINTTPTTYSLEVAGTQQINDGTGTLTFSNGIQKSSGGFNSITGTVSAFTNTIIGEWRRGIVMVSAQDTFTHIYYTFNIFGVSVSGTNFAVVLISGSSNGMSITQSSSNIVLLNSQGLGMMDNFQITYFRTL
jgi:hypothetical protein